MSPTRRAVLLGSLGLLAALVPAWLGGKFWLVWLLFLVWSLLLLGIDAMLLPRRKALRCRLDAPERIYIGDSDSMQLTLHTGMDRRLRYTAVAEFEPRLRAQPAQSGRTEPQATTTRWTLQPLRRGPCRVERAWIRLEGPLGLMRRQFIESFDHELRIVPNTGQVREVALRFFSPSEHREGLKVERFRGDGSEFDLLKEYFQGDDYRRIDWKHSARHRKLLVRQHRAERNHQIVLAIDTGHLMAEPVEGIPKLDHGLRAALLLSYIGLKTGDRVGLFSFHAQVGSFIAPRAGVQAQQVLAHAAAGLEYSLDETNFTLGLTTLAQRMRRRALIIILTDFVDTVTAELMVENCTRLARRHLLLFVALRDPGIARATDAAPDSSLQLQRTVVAQRFAQEREAVFKRLRGRGVLTIDAEPSQVTAPLINRYLDIKRNERI